MPPINTNALQSRLKILNPYRTIIQPLKLYYGMSFIYAIVFPDKSYDILMENDELLTEFVYKVEESRIYCKHNVTRYPIKGYNVTLWNDNPTTTDEWLYQKYNICNAATVSKVSADGTTEMWGFTADKDDARAQDIFVNRQYILIEAIHYFESRKSELLSSNNGAFKLAKFSNNIQKSCYEEENQVAQNFLNDINSKTYIATKSGKRISPAQLKTLAAIAMGSSRKDAAVDLDVTESAIKRNIERMSSKTGLHGISKLARFFWNNISESQALRLIRH